MTVDGNLAGFCAMIHQPHPKVKNMKRVHRLVILPQFQGMGLGEILSSHVADLFFKQNIRIRIGSSHPSLYYRYSNSPLWTYKGKKKNEIVYDNKSIRNRFSSGDRSIFTFEYTGGEISTLEKKDLSLGQQILF